MSEDAFNPPPGLRSPHIQSLLASSKIRGLLADRRSRALAAVEQEWVLDGGEGIRLIGLYSPQPGTRRGVAVLLHGWEGSVRSNYMLLTGARLYAAGYDVFRLNFRDHGDTHHLNKGIFHSCRINEVIHALGDMQDRTGCADWHIAGFSLGGNFALRVALLGPERGLGICNAVAVCPVIDPSRAIAAMENGPRLYERYYNRKWTRSLLKKRTVFPDEYDYDGWLVLDGMREKTRFLATRYYGFSTVEDYFEGYSIAGDRLAALTVPASILAAADDPVIPISDFEALPRHPGLEITVTSMGGHCGYLRGWSLESWAEEYILHRFNTAA